MRERISRKGTKKVEWRKGNGALARRRRTLRRRVMNERSYLRHLPLAALTIIAVLACRQTTTTRSEPKAVVVPITIGSDLTRIDLCPAIPREDIEAVMGRKLINP